MASLAKFEQDYHQEPIHLSLKDSNSAPFRIVKYCINRPHLELGIPACRRQHLLKTLNDEEIFVILLRYHTLNSLNNQLAIPPKLYDQLEAIRPIQAELFASPLNVNFKTTQFCSIFPDIERKCGSRGSFFQVTPPGGLYFSNPPYDEGIMDAMAERLIMLCGTATRYTFFSVLPVWDRAGVKEMKGVESKWDEFRAIELLKGSGYLKTMIPVPQARAQFINYSTLRIITPCNIYALIISNDDTFPITQYERVLREFYLE